MNTQLRKNTNNKIAIINNKQFKTLKKKYIYLHIYFTRQIFMHKH